MVDFTIARCAFGKPDMFCCVLATKLYLSPYMRSLVDLRKLRELGIFRVSFIIDTEEAKWQ